ncbi:MAG: endonuclease domain-containing protein [Taibaiella sp.]|nr:endonuclease domain-containing protein [Taibaiella sp.]
MDKQRIHTLKPLKNFRTQLRHNLTPAEAALWRVLKNKQLQGRKFIRQHSIEYYIADFYCPSEKLIIELDGQVHYTPGASENDFVRDERLGELGFKVLRFENKMVFEHIEGVVAQIVACFNHPD